MVVFQVGKYLIFTLFFFSLISELSGLQCRECFWSDKETDYDEDHEDSKESEVELKYPKVKIFFNKNIKGTPTQEEIEANCKKKTCDPGQWCMKYSLSSSHPKKITRMCIGNPKQRSGCYQQVVETKDLKDAYLIKEACLCNDRDLCNTSSHSFSNFPFVFFISLIIFLFKFNEKHH